MDDFKVEEDEVWGISRAFVKVTSELSKNHQCDSKVVSDSGIIPFMDIYEVDKETYLDPGKFMEDIRAYYPEN